MSISKHSDADGAPLRDRRSLRPRQVLGLLPRYAAGKPPVALDGIQGYKLSSNENALPPLEVVREAIIEQSLSVNRYPDPATTTLRAELACVLDVPAEDIVTGAGSLGALNQILAAFAGQNDFDAPDEVIYPWRSFEAYPICIGLAGARGMPVPLCADGTHDLDAMSEAVTDRTRVILLCTPNNPTGPALGADAVDAFLARIPPHIVIVLDEAYQEFVRDRFAVDGRDIYRSHPNLVVLRTFSKAHGLAGLRVGYSLSQQVLSAHLRLTAVPFAVSQVAEHAAVASLRHLPEVLERVQGIVAERDRVTTALAALGWDIPSAEGNFVWLPLAADTDGFAAIAARHGLALRAFSGDGVRVSIGEPEANSRFIELCAAYYCRKATNFPAEIGRAEPTV